MLALTATPDRYGLALARDVVTHTLRQGIHEAVKLGGDAAIRYAIVRHAHTRRSGLLTSRSALKWRPTKRNNKGAEIEFMNIAPYAMCVEAGAKPHEIWPKEGHGFTGPLKPSQSRRAIDDIGTHRIALRWYVGGRPVFARMVKHPGNKPMPFMRPAANDGAGPAIVNHIERVVVPQIIRQLGT